MLNEIERKLAAILGDGLAARNHLSIVEGGVGLPDAAKGIVRVSIADFQPASFFAPDEQTIGGGSPAPVRRVLPLAFHARVDFAALPADNTPAAATAARIRMLEDISLAAHLLGADAIRDGTGFQTAAPDPGFSVESFALQQATLPADTAGIPLSAELIYLGEASIWPPNVTSDVGRIVAVDPIIATLPIDAVLDSPSVRAGSGARVHIRGVHGKRLTDPTTGARNPVRFAVNVVSDLPMAQRGSITTGDAGVETGFRLVTSDDTETLIDYKAPSGDLGTTRVEFVAIHLAKPDGHSGAFLGSVAVPLVPGVGP